MNIVTAESVQQMFLKHGDFCYLVKHDNDLVDLFTLGSLLKIKENAGLVRAKINEEIGQLFDNVLHNYEFYTDKVIKVGNHKFSMKNVYVLGILNVTPDSFSDGGRFSSNNDAVEYGLKMWNDGADIIDIGGESTRPGSQRISIEEEISRVLPVIKLLKDKNPEIVISIDTSKAAVAQEALLAGAEIVNDISAMTFDDNMADTVANHDATIILMHIKGTPENMQSNPNYIDVFDEVYEFLYKRIKFAKKKRINNIIIDPGFGFGKTLSNNFELLNRINEFKSLGYPILTGVSRKSMLGMSLNLDINSREVATIIAETIAVNNGARFIRTHNVENAVQLKKLVNFVNNPEYLTNV